MRKNLSSTWREALWVGLAPDPMPTRAKALPTGKGLFSAIRTGSRDARTMAPYDASLSWIALMLLLARHDDGVFGLDRHRRGESLLHRISSLDLFPVAARVVPGRASLIAASAIAFQVPDEHVAKACRHGCLCSASWATGAGAASGCGARTGERPAKRWLPRPGSNMQPSEFMKVAVVLYAADYTARKSAWLDARQQFKKKRGRALPMLAVMLVVGWLLLREPDFGAFVVIVVDRHGHPVPRRHERRALRLALLFGCLPHPRRALPHAAHFRPSWTRGPIPSAGATSCRIR